MDYIPDNRNLFHIHHDRLEHDRLEDVAGTFPDLRLFVIIS